MKVLSVRLKSIFVVGAVLLAVTLSVFFMASLVNDTVLCLIFRNAMKPSEI